MNYYCSPECETLKIRLLKFINSYATIKRLSNGSFSRDIFCSNYFKPGSPVEKLFEWNNDEYIYILYKHEHYYIVMKMTYDTTEDIIPIKDNYMKTAIDILRNVEIFENIDHVHISICMYPELLKSFQKFKYNYKLSIKS